MDYKGDFGCLSVYNTSNDIYDKIKENSEVYVMDPLL